MATFFKKMSKCNSKGVYLLEYALILPFALALILGAVDTVQYVKTYAALRTGVQEGLRCLYPTDPDCVTPTIPQAVPLQELFLPPFYTPLRNYDGVAKHFLLPDYSFGPIEAWVLDNATFSIQQPLRYGLERELLNGEGVVKAVYAVMPSASGHVQNAAMEGGVSVYSGTPRVEGAVSRCTTSQTTSRIGSFEFQMPSSSIASDPDLSRIITCIAEHGRQHEKESCEGWNIKSGSRIMINIHGDGFVERTVNGRSSRSTDGSVNGFLKIDLEHFQNGRWENLGPMGDLGGQAFSGQRDQNFIPRGINLAEANSYFRHRFDNSETEVEHYRDHFVDHGIIYAEYNERYRITFRLAHVDGAGGCDAREAIGWELDAVDIRMPEYGIRTEHLPCRGGFPRSAFGPGLQCGVDTGSSSIMGLVSQTPGTHFGPVLETRAGQMIIGIDDPWVSTVCYEQLPSKEQLLQERGVAGQFWNDFRISNNRGPNGCSTNLERQTFCDANHGVQEFSSSDERGVHYVGFSPEAVSLCHLPTNVQQESVRINEKKISIGEAPKLSGQDCTYREGTALSDSLVPENLRSYKKLELPKSHRAATSTPFFTGAEDPAELKKKDLRYACASVEINSKYLDEAHTVNLPPEERAKLEGSLFIGTYADLGCTVEKSLRNEAIRIGMHAESYFSVTAHNAILGTAEPIRADAIDSCTTVISDQSLEATNLRTKIPGGPFDIGVVPASCLIQGINRCIGIPAGVRILEDPTVDPFQVNIELAKARVQTAVHALSPCSDGRGCADVEVGRSQNEQSIEYSITAKTKVPTLLLAANGLNVTYSNRRKWEGSRQ